MRGCGRRMERFVHSSPYPSRFFFSSSPFLIRVAVPIYSPVPLFLYPVLANNTLLSSVQIFSKGVQNTNRVCIAGERLSSEGHESTPFESRSNNIVVRTCPRCFSTALMRALSDWPFLSVSFLSMDSRSYLCYSTP